MLPFQQKLSPNLLRKCYAEITRGWSEIQRDGKPIYVKHLTQFDQTEIDIYHDFQLEKARKRGIPSEAERTAWLEKKGIWTKANERDLAMQQSFVKNLEVTKSKAFLRSQIAAQEKVLIEERKRLAAMVAIKEGHYGLTDDKFAAQKMQFYYIGLSFFKDKGLTKKLFSQADVDEMDEFESYELLHLYIDFINRFDISIIKGIAVAPFFANVFYLCGDDTSRFFGKPIVDLTFYQTNLLSYGIYFKNLISNEKIPEAIRDNPDKIEEFVNRSKASKDALRTNLSGQGSTGIVGATSEDFKDLGLVEDKNGLHMQKRE